MEVSKLNRFLALLIDGIIFLIPAYIIGALGFHTIDSVISLLSIVYLLIKDALFEGQSIGKKVMKYKAVKEDGSSLKGDFVTSLMRNITLFIPLLDAVLVLIDKPRLGDNIAKTKVVNV